MYRLVPAIISLTHSNVNLRIAHSLRLPLSIRQPCHQCRSRRAHIRRRSRVKKLKFLNNNREFRRVCSKRVFRYKRKWNCCRLYRRLVYLCTVGFFFGNTRLLKVVFVLDDSTSMSFFSFSFPTRFVRSRCPANLIYTNSHARVQDSPYKPGGFAPASDNDAIYRPGAIYANRPPRRMDT